MQIPGGADTVRQYLDAGLVDELQLHVVPILLGAGNRLFDGLRPGFGRLTPNRLLESPTGVTHVRYAIS